MKAFLENIKKRVKLSPQDEEIILENCQIEDFKKGALLINAGEVCRYEYFVIKGCLRTSFLDKDGNNHVISFAIEDWWAGDPSSFFEKAPAIYNVDCLEASKVVKLSTSNLEFLYEKVPQLERFFRILIQKAYVSAQKRIVNNFSLTAKERFLLFQKQYPDIEQRIPQYMIASYIGVTKEFFSKMRKDILVNGN